MFPIINKPTRVTKKTATAIDHIITNCFVDTNFKTAIFKSDISDHFLICVFLSPMIDENKNEVTYIYKRNINSETIEKFNQKLYEIDWNEVKSCEHPSESYEIFLTKFLSIYDDFFPKKKIKVKSKDIQSPWITAGIKKSSKRKQRLYENFLKCRSQRNENEYKNYKRLFETIKKRSKKLHFSKLIVKYKDNIKKTWSVIKEVIGKEKIQQQNFPQKICIGNKEITDLKTIAEKFNKFFTEIGPNLAKDIEPSSVTFDNYLKILT